MMNILVLVLLLVQAQAPVQPASVSGMVTKPGGNEPLAKATITLGPVTPGQVRTVVTEDDGRFTLPNVPPGEYRLTAQSDRYGQISYGQRKPGGPGAILALAAGRQVADLRLSMIPTGAIAGRITGRNGEPLVFAAVQAFRYVYENGRKVLTPAQATRSDDRGEYRLFWLPAGQYFVAATAATSNALRTDAGTPLPPGSNAAALADSYLDPVIRSQLVLLGEVPHVVNARLRILEDGTTQEEAWAPVYYPATTEARLAAPLDVAAGSTRTGIDIVIGPARVQSIRGQIVGFVPGSIPTVSLVPQDSGGSRSALLNRGASTVDGSFAFTGVLPGDYILGVRDQRSGLAGPPYMVRVGAGDVENVVLSMGQAVNVTVRVTVEGNVAAPPNSISLRPQLDSLPLGLGSVIGQLDPRTGSYVLSNVAPGDYFIQTALYVKSARLGQTDITGGVRIDTNTRDTIEVVLTPDGGSVEGVAIGRAAPAPNTTVVLVPNARKRFDLYKSVVTGLDGRFRFPALAPGEYKLFAWEDVETGAWQDPDFIRNHESKGTPVRISEKSKEDVQLNVIYP